jgi:hypothetical protein
LSTVDAISHLAARVARMRMLLIVTDRQNEMAATGHPFSRLRGEVIARGQWRVSARRPFAHREIISTGASLAFTRMEEARVPTNSRGAHHCTCRVLAQSSIQHVPY